MLQRLMATANYQQPRMVARLAWFLRDQLRRQIVVNGKWCHRKKARRLQRRLRAYLRKGAAYLNAFTQLSKASLLRSTVLAGPVSVMKYGPLSVSKINPKRRKFSLRTSL